MVTKVRERKFKEPQEGRRGGGRRKYKKEENQKKKKEDEKKRENKQGIVKELEGDEKGANRQGKRKRR